MLDSRQLSGLDAHKYSCVGRSITEPALQIFWNWLVEFVPLWVAPESHHCCRALSKRRSKPLDLRIFSTCH